MHRTDQSNHIATGLVAVVLALAATLALPAVARAQMPAGYAPDVEQELAMLEQSRASEIPYLSHGIGVTRSATESGYQGVNSPDGFQPQLRGGDSLVIREAPDGSQPQLHRSGNDVTVSASTGRSLDADDLALGFAAGLLFSLMAAIAITFSSRNRVGAAHS